jgi:hypothetical protein
VVGDRAMTSALGSAYGIIQEILLLQIFLWPKEKKKKKKN